MREYVISVEERHTAYYTVEANSPEEALEKWHAGESEYTHSEFVETLPDSEEVEDA